MKTVVPLLMLILVSGCGKQRESCKAYNRIDDDIARFMPPIGGTNHLQEKTSSLARKIRALPNYEERRARVNQWVDRMLSFDMRTLDFYNQGRNIRAVHDLVMTEVRETLGGDSPTATEDVWDFYLRMLKWLRDQADRLGSIDRPPSGMAENCVTNAVQAKVFRDWHNCYTLCAGTYKATARRFEKRELDALRKRGVPSSTCEALRRRLEEFVNGTGE